MIKPGTHADEAFGFGPQDPWSVSVGPVGSGYRPKAGRWLAYAVGAVGLTLAALLAIQVFMWWFAPCVKGAC